MATPRVSEKPTIQRQYAGQLLLTAALVAAIRQLWLNLTPTVAPDQMRAFRRGVHVLVPQYGQTAAQQALTNYRIARRDAGIQAPAHLPAPTSVPTSKIDAGLDWAERAMENIDVEHEALIAKYEAAILQRVEAAMQKAVMDEARDVTIAAVVGDEKALGFRRVPRPDACAWCLALATRRTSRRGLAKDFKRYGEPGTMGGDEHWGVYKTRASAGQLPAGTGEVNRFHDNCHCAVEPIFSTDFNVPIWLNDVAKLYDDTDDFNHFRRVIEARRRGEDPPVSPIPALPAAGPVQAQQAAAIADLLGRLAA